MPRSTGSLRTWQEIPTKFLLRLSKGWFEWFRRSSLILGVVGEIDDLYHADRTTPSDLHGLIYSRKGEGHILGYLRSLELSSS